MFLTYPSENFHSAIFIPLDSPFFVNPAYFVHPPLLPFKVYFSIALDSRERIRFMYIEYQID